MEGEGRPAKGLNGPLAWGGRGLWWCKEFMELCHTWGGGAGRDQEPGGMVVICLDKVWRARIDLGHGYKCFVVDGS